MIVGAQHKEREGIYFKLLEINHFLQQKTQKFIYLDSANNSISLSFFYFGLSSHSIMVLFLISASFTGLALISAWLPKDMVLTTEHQSFEKQRGTKAIKAELLNIKKNKQIKKFHQMTHKNINFDFAISSISLL